MKIFLTGANGMLADALCPLLKKAGHFTYFTDIHGVDKRTIFHLDIRDYKQVINAVKEFRPEMIMHLAAETDVDKCELNPDYAYEVNTKGTENVAMAARDTGASLVYISTGAVFDGKKEGPYIESDKPDPVSVYGKSKLEGEKVVKGLLSRYYIFRAGWMIGGYKKDKKFVAKIVDLIKIKKDISVVIDKFGSPTFTKDFSKGMLSVIASGEYGLYHMVNEGVCSRFDIAKKIVEYTGKSDVVIKPVTSEAFPLPAPRARSEMLSNNKLTLMGINNMRHWHDALKEYIEELEDKYE